MSAEHESALVVFVLPDFNGGGAEQAVLRLVDAWPANLPPPVVAVKSMSGPLVERFRAANVVIVDLGGGTRHSTMSSFRSFFALRRLLVALRPAAVVAVLCAPVVVAAGRSVRRRPRVSVSVQNPIVTERTLTGQSRWRGAITDLTLRLADTLLPISPGIADELQQLGIPATRLRMVPNPVDIDALRSSQPRPQRQKTVVMLARLEPQKRIDVAIEAFAAAELDDWELHIYGTGHLAEALESQADALGLAARVRFQGFSQDTSHLLRTAGIVLLTSEYEGFGNVLVEALAAGARVVSTDAPWGPRFILDGGRFGALCPVNDVQAIATALYTVAHSEDTTGGGNERLERAREFDAEVVAPVFAEAVLSQ